VTLSRGATGGVRLASLIRGRTTSCDVEALFGRSLSTGRRPDVVVIYYAIRVYNPFEDFGAKAMTTLMRVVLGKDPASHQDVFGISN